MFSQEFQNRAVYLFDWSSERINNTFAKGCYFRILVLLKLPGESNRKLLSLIACPNPKPFHRFSLDYRSASGEGC